MSLLPHCTPGIWPEAISERRFAGTFLRSEPEGCQVALIGLPDDTGVRLNGGHPGAGGGPAALRRALAAYGARDPAGIAWPRVWDGGDVRPGPDLDATHRRVTDCVAAALGSGLLPLGIGGGHDLTFPFVRAVAEVFGDLRGLYLDAHLDVRKAPGSGMPFRRLAEDCGLRSLHVQGLDPMSNSRAHLDWFLAHGGHVDDLSPGGSWPEGDLFMSTCLDVIDQAFAPGVSARNPCGRTPAWAAAWARAAGRHPRVRCFDLMELCPPRDEGGRTARLTARLLLEFLRGLGERAWA